MKSPPHSTAVVYSYRVLFVLVFVICFSLSLTTVVSSAEVSYSRSHQLQRHLKVRRINNVRRRSWNTVSRTKSPPGVCYQLQRIRHCPPLPAQPPPPPSSPFNEIDPRYGVEKRLVPSGPNPLHN